MPSICPGSRSTPLAVAAGRSTPGPRPPRRAQRGLLRSGSGHGDGAADRHLRDERHGRGRAAPRRRRGAPRPGPAHRLHGGPAARAARHGCTADHRPGRSLRGGHPVGRPRRACPPRVRRRPGDRWRPGPSPRRRTGPSGPGPGPPQSGVPRAADRSPAAPLPPHARPAVVVAGAADRRAETGRRPSELASRSRAVGSSSSGARRPAVAPIRTRGAWRSPIGSGGRCWPTRCRAAGRTGRSPPPTPSSAPSRRCPRPSSARRALAVAGARRATSSDGRAGGARVVVVDPWRQWADPSRVATEFHQCRDRALAARRRQRHGDSRAIAEWLASWRDARGRGRRRPSPRSSGRT